MEQNKVDWIKCQLLYAEVIRKIDAHFETLATTYMPIKGAYLICCGLSEKMACRHMCDIDIMVMPQDMKRVSDYFFNCENTIPKVYYTDNSRKTETTFYFPIGETKVLVEIHSLLNFPERFTLPTEELFSRSIEKKGMRVLPCQEDALLIFLCHLFTHFPFEWRETNFEEIGLLTEKKDFSWEKFNGLAKKTGLGTFIYYVLKCFSEEKKQTIPLGKTPIYASVLFYCAKINTVRHWPLAAKRLVFELPFVQNPVALVWKKVLNKKTATCIKLFYNILKLWPSAFLAGNCMLLPEKSTA